MSAEVEVTQADRDAAVALIRQIDHRTEYLSEIEDGSYDDNFFVQAFARHRQQSAQQAQAAIDHLNTLCDDYAKTFRDKSSEIAKLRAAVAELVEGLREATGSLEAELVAKRFFRTSSWPTGKPSTSASSSRWRSNMRAARSMGRC